MRIESADDAERLFELARRKSQAGRETLYKNIWDLFENRGGSLSARERELMRDILRRLSRDVEMSIRTKLAENLARNPNAPSELVHMLANDTIEVAYPILMDSRVLQDLDLIEVVRHQTFRHQLAVAMRRNIGEQVSQVLCDTGNPDVISALLNNHTAKISTEVIKELAEQSQHALTYQGALLRRPDLPPDVAQRMYAWVSAALRKYIVDNYEVNVDDIDDTVAEALDAATQQNEPADPERGAQRLIDKLHEARELTSGFLVKALRQGEIMLFELGLAKLCGLRPLLMRRIIYEPGGEGLAVACRAIGLDRAVFQTVYKLTRQARGSEADVPDEEMIELKNYFDGLNRAGASLVLRKWQRNPDYLYALKQIGINR
ncbi:MAG TPA: DUF2336 domain-containing protein [Candidatus Cybelea sp.]|nr:DUF2336 domain-containing protein [Candidatus Cybelea sp.]